MNRTELLAEPTRVPRPVNLRDWETEQRPLNLVEGCRLGEIDLLELSQAPGDYPDPPVPAFNLQLMLGPASGDVEFGGARMRVTVPPGALVLAPANEQCNYILDTRSRFISLSIPEVLLQEVAGDISPAFGKDFGRLHAMPLNSAGVRHSVRSLWESARWDDPGNRLRGEQALVETVVELMRLSRRPETAKRNRYALSPNTLARVLSYLDENLDHDVSLQTLAGIAGLSKFHFLRSFKHDTGDTPHQYVCGRRLSKAMDLLRLTKEPISSVAAACGYASHQHLCAAVSRHYGRRPSSVRGQHAGFV